jgi:hypothetical protein
MAQFRGKVQGNRGHVSRLGTKVSGVAVEAYGWQGGARAWLSHRAEGGDWLEVVLIPHPSTGDMREIVLYHGPCTVEAFKMFEHEQGRKVEPKHSQHAPA